MYTTNVICSTFVDLLKNLKKQIIHKDFLMKNLELVLNYVYHS